MIYFKFFLNDQLIMAAELGPSQSHVVAMDRCGEGVHKVTWLALDI